MGRPARIGLIVPYGVTPLHSPGLHFRKTPGDPMPLRTTFTVLLLTLLSLTAFAAPPEKREGGIVYGPGISFAIEAPEGWTLDTESGQGQGLTAVFYPKGSNWK